MRRIHGWLDEGIVAPGDLVIYRRIFAAVALATLPNFDVRGVPSSAWFPPPGPFQLIHSVPSTVTMYVAQAVLALALGCLLLDLAVTAASWAAAIAYVFGFGVTYSLGHLDHTILLALTPAILSVAWVGRPAQGLTDGSPRWPTRYLALVIGLGFATAGLQKLQGGWLNLHSQATVGQLLIRYLEGSGYGTSVQASNGDLARFFGFDLGHDGVGILGSFVVHSHLNVLFEAMDWATVILECSILICVLSWRWFKVALMTLVAFHVMVMLAFGIAFGWDVIAYGAFVPWSNWIPDSLRRPVRRELRWPVRLSFAAVAAAGAVGLSSALPSLAGTVSTVLVLAAGLGVLAFVVVHVRRRVPSVGHAAIT